MDPVLDTADAAGTDTADGARAGDELTHGLAQPAADEPAAGDPYANLTGNWNIWKVS